MAKQPGIWFLVRFDGNYGALCKAKGKTEFNHQVRNEIASAKHMLETEVTYEFFAPLRQVPVGRGPDGQPVMAIGRESIPTGNHFMLEKNSTFVNMAQAKFLNFLDDMTAFDRNKYEEFIAHVEGSLEEQRKQQSPLAFPDGPKDMRIPVGQDGVIDLGKMR